MKKHLSLFIVFCFCLYGFNLQAQLFNRATGIGSGVSITTGDYNQFYGDSTGSFLVSGRFNTLMGFAAGRSVIGVHA